MNISMFGFTSEEDTAEEDYFPDSIVYTEDGIPVKRVHFFRVPPEMREDELKAYFLNFGHVLELRLGNDPRKKFVPCLSGDVLFANAEDAAKALECRAPYVDAMGIKIEPSYSWLQPDAYGPPAEDQQQDLGPISILTDECWVHILQFLGMRDQVRFARSCQRFRAIYQMATAGQFKSVRTRDIYHEEMTLWDIRDFFQLSGEQVQDALCMGGSRYHDEVVDLVSVYCRNLNRLCLYQAVLTKYTLLKMPPSIERLKLSGQKDFKDLPIICKHFSKLRELSLTVTKVSGPAWSYIVKENCCPSLEVLEISVYGNSKCEIVAQLPKLKSLTIDIEDNQTGLDVIDQLVKYKAEQLERFKFSVYGDLNIGQLSQIAKLTGLRTLTLVAEFGDIPDELKELVVLKKLEEISFNGLKVSYSAILELFIGCPKLRYLKARYMLPYEQPYELSLEIVAQVRREMVKKEIHRKLPIELVLDIDHKKMNELILNNPETMTEDIIKINSTRIPRSDPKWQL